MSSASIEDPGIVPAIERIPKRSGTGSTSIGSFPPAPATISCSLAEIQEAIEKLASEDRARLREWFDAQYAEETDELLAAIDEGIRSAETERTFSLEGFVVRSRNGLRSPLDG